MGQLLYIWDILSQHGGKINKLHRCFSKEEEEDKKNKKNKKTKKKQTNIKNTKICFAVYLYHVAAKYQCLERNINV